VDAKVVEWSPQPRVQEELLLVRSRPALLQESNILAAAAKPSERDESRYDINVKLTPAAGERFARGRRWRGNKCSKNGAKPSTAESETITASFAEIDSPDDLNKIETIEVREGELLEVGVQMRKLAEQMMATGFHAASPISDDTEAKEEKANVPAAR